MCNSGCCPPNPQDCTELVSENNEADWVSLKLECDNQTTCNYLFTGSIFIGDCASAGEVDYMNVYFSCLPGLKWRWFYF